MAAPWRRQPGGQEPGRDQPRRGRAPSATPQQPLHITRLDPKPKTAAWQPAQPPDQVPTDLSAARFTSPAAALTCVAATGDAARRAYPAVRRAPDGSIWVLVRPGNPAQAELTWALGGVVYLPDGTNLASARGRRHAWADVLSWPDVSLIELAASVSLNRPAM